MNLSRGQLDPTNTAYNELYNSFAPLAEELLNSISVTGRKWEILPGKEIYENIRYLSVQLETINLNKLPQKYVRSFNSVYLQLTSIIDKFKPLYGEIIHLLKDSTDLRKELGKKHRRSKTIKSEVKTWIYRLQSRLKRCELEYDPEKLKYKLCTHQISEEEIWQQWIRLEWSYHKGLYHSYDSPKFEKTNNATEQLINRTKRHFRKWLGQQDIQTVFQYHGASYAQIIELDYSPQQVNEILWKQSSAFAPGNISPLEWFQPAIRRNWHISTIDSGNIEQLKRNLRLKN